VTRPRPGECRNCGAFLSCQSSVCLFCRDCVRAWAVGACSAAGAALLTWLLA
jgi:hypothetical protein